MNTPATTFSAPRAALAATGTALAGWLPPSPAPLAAATAAAARYRAAGDLFAATATQLAGTTAPDTDQMATAIRQVLAQNQAVQPVLTQGDTAWAQFVAATTGWLRAGTDGSPVAGPLTAALDTALGAVAAAKAALTASLRTDGGWLSATTVAAMAAAAAAHQRLLADQAHTAAAAAASAAANVATAAAAEQAALAAATGKLDDLAAAVAPGSPPLSADRLAAQLATVAELRQRTQPWPADFRLRIGYRQRTAELAAATATLLGASAGVGSAPAALLPVRLETRLRTDPVTGLTLCVRVFPDDIAIDSHDPDLTADEAATAATLRAALAAGGPPAAATWDAAVRRHGIGRTAYLAAVDPSTVKTGRGMWPRPPHCAVLPDRWLAVAYDDEGAILAAGLGSPIDPTLQIGPDLRATAPTTSADHPVEAGLAWLTDYSTAVAAGMAVTLPLDGGARNWSLRRSPAAVATVIVVGVHIPAAGEPAPARRLGDLLTAHRFTDGFAVLTPGTPTNNTDDEPSGYRAADDAAAALDREVTHPAATGRVVTADTARLAASLGVDPAVFVATGPARDDATAAQAAAVLAWPSTGAIMLPWLGVTDAATLAAARAWVCAFLRPAGPLPTIRVGSQPYGVLPAITLRHYAPEPDARIAATVIRIVGMLLPDWRAAGRGALGSLSATPVAVGASARLAVAAPVNSASGLPAWLPPGVGLMGLDPDGIRAALGDTANAFASLTALTAPEGTPPTWPPGLLLMPDPPAPAWSLSTVDPAADRAFLTQLLISKQVPGGGPAATLLAALAAVAWTSTAGVAASTATALTPAGLPLALGQRAAPAVGAADEVHAATASLAGPDVDLPGLVGGVLDGYGHRLDAWVTAVATERLARVRRAPAAGAAALVLGGYGIVAGLTAAAAPAGTDAASGSGVQAAPADAAYLHAPGLAQATTAAVLRSGYLSHRTTASAAEAPFAIDLSSRRARLACWLLDGVRQGQSLAALLGYRFERTLVETGAGALVAPFRKLAPLDLATAQDPAQPITQPSASATDVVDGVTLLAIWRNQRAKPTTGPGQAVLQPSAQQAFAEMSDALDAVSDAVTAQALHALLRGDGTAAATLQSVADGVAVPDIGDFLDTPRTGTAVVRRVALVVDAAAALGPGWSATPRTHAEPALSAWLSQVLPRPTTVAAAVVPLGPGGEPLPGHPPLPVTLDRAGLGPLDLLALAGRRAELDLVLAEQAITAASVPGAAGGRVQDPPAGTGTVPLTAVLDVAARLATAMGASRPADARDRAPTTADTAPGIDTADLDNRATAAVAALDAAIARCAAALPGAPPPGTTLPPTGLASAGADALRAALRGAFDLGVPASAPVIGPVDALARQCHAAWGELLRRSTAARAVPADGHTALAKIDAVFAGSCPIAPRQPGAAAALAAARIDTAAAAPGQDPLAWIAKVARVRPAVADAAAALDAAEAAGWTTLTATEFQVPAATSAPWAGGPLPTGATVAPGTVCLTALGGPPPPNTGDIGALVLADWTETIPATHETTAVTFSFPTPPARAPQTVLLAVPPDPTQPWSYTHLLDTIRDTVDLAYARACSRDNLAMPWNLLMPAVYLPNTLATRPAVAAGFPTPFLQPSPLSTVTAVTVAGQPSPPGVVQGSTTALQIQGHTLAAARPGDVVLDPPAGVRVVSYTPVTGSADTAGTLTLTVDPAAPLGPRSIRIGTGLPLTAAFTVTPRPVANQAAPTVIAQQKDAYQAAVTVFGQVLGNADVSITMAAGHDSLLTVAGKSASTDQTALTVTLTVAPAARWPHVFTPIGKPIFVTLPPSYPVAAALAVTPQGGTTATFALVVDTMTVWG